MIEWIKFKGNTEEERKNEIIFNDRFIVIDKNKVTMIGTSLIGWTFKNCTHWAPFNLPEEDKWERVGVHDIYLTKEFDNIYSILNELRKR